MSTTQHDSHDQQVIDELKKLGNVTIAVRFVRALELGATPALLSGIASGYLQYSPDDHYVVTGLPYVDDLLSAGWTTTQVREFVESMCFNEESDTSCSHRDGFWNGTSNHAIFSKDAYVAFMKRFATEYEGYRRLLTESGKEILETRLAWFCKDKRELDRYVREIEAVAAGHLTMIENEYQLNQMIRYASSGRNPREITKKQSVRAGNVGNWGWNVAFRGYVLSKMRVYSEEYSYIFYTIQQTLESRPEWAVGIYRWLAEGFYRADNQYWEFGFERQGVKSYFEQHDWVFAKVQRVGDRLQVAISHKGQRAIIKHIPGDESLEAGDEVMISPMQLKDLTPRHQPGGKVYELTLSPARRPTPEQLNDKKALFPFRK